MILLRLPRGRHGRQRRAAFLGALLGLGSPLGLLVLRLLAGGIPFSGFLNEINANFSTYLYTLAGTISAFAAFGFFLGRNADALEEQLLDVERLSLELRRVARTDGLTGAGTRRHLMEKLDELIDDARRSGRPLACLFVDVDNLKALNDRHGHRAGDDALILASAALQTHLRRGDVLGRYGGDEFVALLPDTDLEAAKACAERVRAEAASMEVPIPGGRTSMSLSIGVYSTKDLPKNAFEFLNPADQALQKSKATGRNRVVAA